MDTGGLAQMTYNNGYPNNNGYPSNGGGFGSATTGYGSRGKGAHIKRLSVAPPSGMNSIHEDEEVHPAPRTARSQLLAGLRTAPRQSNNVAASASYAQQDFNHDPSTGRNTNSRYGAQLPQSATASHFNRMSSPSSYSNNNRNSYQNMYSVPEQVQAPPESYDQHENMDSEMYNMLMQQNDYLVQKQQQLQQQLTNMHAATQQFQGMNLNNGYQQAPPTPMTPGMNMYSQQQQNGVQPIVSATAQPGIFAVFNPMTGQTSFMYENQLNLPVSPPLTTPGLEHSSPPSADVQGRFSRKETTSPFNQGFNKGRNTSPPKPIPSPQRDVTPLPPPSANAYRPGHGRSMSNAMNSALKNKDLSLNGPRTAEPTRSVFPRTPMTGTFGPGMARAGEHPVRQPKGPPPMDELTAAPTALHEGSKNFASRQRRRAVFDLVKAGKERQTGRNGSSDMGTPNSEAEFNFTISDADSEGSSSGTGSASLSGDATFGNAKTTATAIGTEWKELKERAGSRTSTSRPFSASGIGGLDGTPGSPRDFAGALKGEERAAPAITERRSPLLVLTSAAEKRKSTLL